MPPRSIVRMKGETLIRAMKSALSSADETLAQLVAAECVVDAEIKDHANWELIGEVAGEAKGQLARTLQETYEQVEEALASPVAYSGPMMSLRRTRERETIDLLAGTQVKMVSETWSLILGHSPAGLGLWYHRPLRIEVGGLLEMEGPEPVTRAIRDHVMLVRLGALLTFIFAVLARRSQP